MPNAEIHTIEGVARGVPILEPEAFSPAVLDFVGQP